MNKIDRYKNKFPYGLEEFCKGLSTKERVAIASLLYEKGPLGRDVIVKHLGTENRKEIDSNLQAMSNCGIIKRVNNKFVDNVFISEFDLSLIYQKLIESCVDILSTAITRSKAE